ncbi:MAG: dockerin type I repeat-containing protein [Clostridia bacterium]|nr:dockerin type I repeat-containing protein [Clostridia bacterium]
MKKLICVLITVVIAVSAVCPSAVADSIKYGDVDCNGSINSGDALAVLQHSTNLKTLDESALVLADVNGDGSVNSGDALSILQFATSLIASFPVEEKKVPSTKEELLDYYKKIAAENKDIVTAQTFNLVDIDVGSFILNPAFKTLATMVLDANTVEVSGFPGDVENISVDDLSSATYVVNDDGTVTVKLNVKPQTDTLEGSKYEGPVGRTIGVVGNIPQVVVDTGVDDIVNVDNATGELAYEDASVTVTVDKDNKLVKGKCAWQYTVLGDIKGFDISYSALAINLENGAATGEIDYKLAY